jgi:hypothetical protein
MATENELLYSDYGYGTPSDPRDFDSSLIYGDPGYAGDTFDPESLTRFADADYYRNKISEFQATLNAVDLASAQLRRVYEIDGLPEDIWYEALSLLNDYESRRGQFVLAAEAINLASAAANAAGFRMPVVSLPQTLGIAPIALAGIGAAVAGAAALITWGVAWINGAHATAMRIGMLETLAPEDRAKAVAAALEIERAQAAADNPLSTIALTVRWIAIAAVGFFVWKAYQQYAS